MCQSEGKRMPNIHDERAPTQHAAPTATLSRPVIPSDPNETPEAGARAGASPTHVIPFRLTRHRLPLLAGGASVLLAALLLAFLANGARGSSSASHRPLPTPTATS